MSKQIQKQKSAPQEQEQEQEAKAEPVVEDAQALKDTMDELLDEIDSVLEKNAEEFVKGYVQKGGE